MPSAVGIVSDQFGEHRAQAIGLFTSIFPIGGIIGPNLGGYMLHHWSWRDAVLRQRAAGIVVLIGVYKLLLKDRRADQGAAHRLPWHGALRRRDRGAACSG